MFDRIVVGFNESDRGRDALTLGRVLADRTGAELVAALVLPYPAGNSLVPALPVDAWNEMVAGARAGLERAAGEFGARTELTESSSPTHGLQEVTERLGGDLLVLGSHRSDPGKVRAGRKARQLMSGSRFAVALAPAGYAQEVAGLDRIGVAVDGSPESDRALDAAVELLDGGRLRLIAVAGELAEGWGHWGSAYALSELKDISRKMATRALEHASSRLPEGVEAETDQRDGPAAGEIQLASAEDLDLLCIGSRGYGPVRRILLGSTSSEVIRDASCPVLIGPRGSD